MRHMGNSGKFAVITGIVAAGLLVLTGMTLAEPVFVAFLGVLGLACIACIMEILRRRRYVMLALAGLSTSLTIAGSLAFLSTWELAFTDESSLFGTPLPTDDPDNYFFLAALSLLTALAALFVGAVWPAPQRLIARAAPGRAAPGRASSRSGNGARPGAPVRRQSGAAGSQPRTSSAGRTQVRQPTSSARQVPQSQSAARQSAAGQSANRQGSAGQPPRRPAPKK
ncbi:hypothetical protein FBY31_3523 [Arthrobacter sp. SLBN-100]|uniref:hypothetical protein n=1 Tax=Arthrobacter sp. SLBN-100 TaxID=2768450 RepID=UPI00116BF8B9|nr:hypothetical protein [Arthrobacter sp. SLBN-100]TQJ69383.1 hypothetical protein FBY31_3523 [Arthrobacter sp. SLBN-100]